VEGAAEGLPEAIGGFRVQGLLGRGASGVVYRVIDPKLDRPAALKLLFEQGDRESRERFRIEACAAGRILHPNVVQVFSAGEHEGRAFIVQELVEGVPLSALLETRGPLGFEIVVDIGVQVAHALEKAAEVGVLHRDVKPENLLVSDEGTVKVADFGLAKLLQAPTGLTEGGTTLGTPHYMSPEQGRAAPLDARSDQYSLGATLYHLLTGAPPFHCDHALALLFMHLTSPLPPVSSRRADCPPGLARVIERMLEKDREARFPSFLEVAEALESSLEESASEFAPTPEVRGASPARARAAFLWAMLGAASLAALSWFVLPSAEGPSRSLSVPAVAPPVRSPLPVQTALPVAAEPHGPPAPSPAAVVDPTPTPLSPRRAPVLTPFEQAISDLRQTEDLTRARRAAETLGQLGDQAATPALLSALSGGRGPVASAAADALGALADIAALDGLEVAAEDAEDPSVRRAAQRALKRIIHVEE
jgi:serine/threonine-protein kinase